MKKIIFLIFMIFMISFASADDLEQIDIITGLDRVSSEQFVDLNIQLSSKQPCLIMDQEFFNQNNFSFQLHGMGPESCIEFVENVNFNHAIMLSGQGTLYGNGFSISNIGHSTSNWPDFYGILVKDNFVIENLIINNGSLELQDHARADRITILNGQGHIVAFRLWDNSLIKNSFSFNNDNGFALFGPSTIAENCIAQDSTGPGLYSIGFVALYDSSIIDSLSINNDIGFFLNGNAVVENSIASENNQIGFRLQYASQAINSISKDNSGYGFYLTQLASIVSLNNVQSMNNLGDGIYTNQAFPANQPIIEDSYFCYNNQQNMNLNSGVLEGTIYTNPVNIPGNYINNANILPCDYVPNDLIINPMEATIHLGDIFTFSASGGLSGNYNWEIISGHEYCNIVSINQNIIEIEGSGLGSCFIQVEDSGQIANSTLTVIELSSVPELRVMPIYAGLFIGAIQTLFADGGSGSYSWSIISGEDHCNILNSRTSSVEIQGVSQGTCLVQVQSSGKTAVSVIQIFDLGSQPVLEINPKHATIFLENQINLQVSGGITGRYRWSILSGREYCTLSATSGNNVQVQGIGTGTCEVQVEDSGKRTTATITVVDLKPVPDLRINPHESSIFSGNVQRFMAFGGSERYTWKINSGNLHCSIIDSNHNSITVLGLVPGSCEIELESSGKRVIATLNILNLGGQPNLFISPKETEILVEGIQSFNAFGGISERYTWEIISGRENCVIQNIGNTNQVNIRGVNVGSCVLQVENSKKLATALITVTKPGQIPDVVIEPRSATIHVSGIQEFSAYGGLGTYTWSLSGNCNLQHIQNNKVQVQGLNQGKCIILVESGGKKDEANLEIIGLEVPQGLSNLYSKELTPFSDYIPFYSEFVSSPSGSYYLADKSNLYFKNDGLGIGISNPLSRLHVQGNMVTDNILIGDLIQINGLTGEIKTGGTSGYIRANSFLYNSDLLLKEKINSLNDFEKIKNIQTHYFNYKDDETKKIGLLAQELELLFPTLVYEDDDGFKSVDYVSIIPILIKLIQEQELEIKMLLNKVENENEFLR